MHAQSCPILCDRIDCSPPGSFVRGIFKARILEGLPFPTPGDLPDSGIEPMSPEVAGRFFTTVPPGKPHYLLYTHDQTFRGTNAAFFQVPSVVK